MNVPLSIASQQRARNLLYLTTPRLWPVWPYLPLIQRRPGQEEAYGILFDALHVCGLPGYSATVFLTNLFLMPRRLDELLALPRQVFDTPEEIVEAGWRVD